MFIYLISIFFFLVLYTIFNQTENKNSRAEREREIDADKRSAIYLSSTVRFDERILLCAVLFSANDYLFGCESIRKLFFFRKIV